MSSTAGLEQAYGVGNVAGVNSGVTVNAGTGPSGATNAAVSINTTAGMSGTGADALAGQIILTNSSNGTAVTFNMGGTADISGNTITLGAGTSTVNDLVDAINSNATLGMTASVNSTTGALQLQAQATDTAITVGGTGLTDATSEALNSANNAQVSKESQGTLTLGSGAFTGTDALTGSFSVQGADGNTTNYVMYGSTATFTSGTTVNLSQANSTVTGLVNSLYANQGITAAIGTGPNTNVLTLTSGNTDSGAIGVTNNNLSDSLGTTAATASLGTFSSESDQVSGTLEYSVGGSNYNIGSGSLTGMTAGQLINEINYGNIAGTGTEGVNGVTASWQSSGNGTFGSIELTSNTYGANGNITNNGPGTSINDLGTSASLSYTTSSAYNTGISNVAGSGVYDAATQSAPGGVSAPYANLTSSSSGSSGTATISYSDGAGQSLSATDLSNQTDAQSALTNLELGHYRRGGAGRLHRRADQHAELRQPGAQHATGERGVGAERGAGHRLCFGNVEYVQVRDSEPDRHRRSGAGQQHPAGSDQAAAVIRRAKFTDQGRALARAPFFASGNRSHEESLS